MHNDSKSVIFNEAASLSQLGENKTKVERQQVPPFQLSSIESQNRQENQVVLAANTIIKKDENLLNENIEA